MPFPCPTPTPPWKFAGLCWTFGAQRRHGEISPSVARGEKLYFQPMFLYSTYSETSRESKNGQKWAFSKIAQNGYPILEHYLAELPCVLVGSTLHMHLESPGFNSLGGVKYVP